SRRFRGAARPIADCRRSSRGTSTPPRSGGSLRSGAARAVTLRFNNGQAAVQREPRQILYATRGPVYLDAPDFIHFPQPDEDARIAGRGVTASPFDQTQGRSRGRVNPHKSADRVAAAPRANQPQGDPVIVVRRFVRKQREGFVSVHDGKVEVAVLI